MTDEQREAYRRAWESAEKRVPKGCRIFHARWADGRLDVHFRRVSGDLEPVPTGSSIPDLPQRPARRGVVQQELGL